ncbi:MAG: HAMP domain-containing protein, partial [Alphaproteobacteria bacterium]|nr:HAMP domain-containing protein [Alphaproteobacteria bacterium]
GADAGNTHMEAFDNASLALAAEMDGARAAILTMDAQAAERDKATEARLRGAQTLSTILCGGMALGACVLGAVVIALTRKRLLRPLAILSDYMGRLAQGDYEREPPFGKRSDELGTMARSIAVFREAAIERRQAREAQEADRDAMEAERRQNEQERASTDTERTRVVSRLAEALGKLSDGDLTSRIETPFPPAFEVLRSDFNSAIARLSTALGAIATGAASMQNGSEEIASAADDLSRRTEQQAASLEQTAAALDEIAQTVNRSTAGAKEAATAVAKAKSDAEKSGEVVNRAVAAMSEIENSSTQIGQIIGVIDEIAFQTNLLALNAGVEAARAGDSGRGFAVVAQEVRALAQRSADAAKQIKGLITQSGAQVAAGVDLVGQTGQTLHKIVQEVIRVDTLVNDIARSAEEQSVGLRQVNTAVNHMDQVTQQNAAMVEQTTAATHSLRSEAIDLARQVAEFKLGPATVSNLRRVA